MSEEKTTYHTCDVCSMPEETTEEKDMSEFEKTHNHENYSDPTCYKAIKQYEKEQQSEWERHHKTIGCILRLCELAGYTVENRIVLKDKRTGKVWE